jgi:glycosyltransferase involved in cell wall biosynthesis
MTQLLASVVVAVHADPRCRRLVDSLVKQTLPAEAYEVIVVENGSHQLADLDGQAGLVRYLHLPVANLPAARNAGLAAARGRFLLLTDADCVAEPDWVEQLTAGLAGGEAAVVGGTIGRYHPGTWVQRYALGIVAGQTRLSYLPALHLPYVAGANAGFDTAKLRAVGGFDQTLRSGNDVDVCYKLGLRGHRVHLVGGAVVWHEDRATLAAHFHRFRHYALYQVLLFAKYRHITGKRFVLDRYPLARAAGAVAAAPHALWRLARGDAGPAARAVLQLVEVIGVLVGEVQGAVRFRQPYL